MIDHTSVSVSDYEKAREFYKAALAPLGYEIGMDLPDYKAAGFKHKDMGGRGDFWIGAGEKAAPIHVAFVGESKEAVDAFYAAGIAAGGKDNGAPGYRTQYSAGYYGAFVHDLDGNNIEAVWRDPSKK
jgi:catechol 2,3-dioxygenase-like lactoylglutathione lyase family enzyme